IYELPVKDPTERFGLPSQWVEAECESTTSRNGIETTMAGKNVLGGELAACSTDPMTGFYRDGCCNTGGSDTGLHVVCAQMTADFLEFSRSRGNDLSTPNPM